MFDSKYFKEWRAKKDHTFFVVYCLPDHNYVGYTISTYRRMLQHEQRGKSTDEWFVLDICKTKAEAIQLEKRYHSLGYEGKNLGEYTSKSVNQYTKEGEFIQTFESINDAAVHVNTHASNITSVLTGRSKSSRGFHWRYEIE